MQQTRRSFLDLMLGTTVVGWLAGVLYPVFRYLTPLQSAGVGGPTTLTRDEIVSLERQRFVIVRVGGQRVLVFEDDTLELHALDARCTHEGCTVQYLPGQSVVWCACHNAHFDLEGRVLSGPPPRPLPKYVAERRDDGDVVVTKGVA